MCKPARMPCKRYWGSSWLGAVACLASCLLTIAAPWVVTPSVQGAESPQPGVEFYERKIRPLLSQRCYECHSKSAKRLEAELALDTRAGILKGGENGPIINPDQPEQSLLLQVVGYDGDIQMPPAGKMSADELALLSEWVKRGAPLPEDGSAATVRQGIDFTAGRKFWSFQPLQPAPLPAVQNANQCASRSDFYLQSALEKRGLVTVSQAELDLARSEWNLLE